MKDNPREQILTLPIGPLLIKMAIPTVIGMMVSTIYNLTDTFWIGRLGDKSMTAAIGIVLAFVSFIQALGFWFGYGSGNTMSRLLGKEKEEEAKEVASLGTNMALVIGLVIMSVLLVFIKPFVGLIGGGVSDSLMRYTTQYLSIMLVCIPFILVSTTIYNQLRLCGNVKDAMLGLLLGMGINMILDPFFILSLGMGIKGAGYATLIGYICSTIYLFYLSYHHGNIPIKLFRVKYSKAYFFHILAGGMPNFARQSITGLATVLLNLVAAKYGETMIAALTVSTKVSTLGYMMMIGFAQGFQPICAMNYGAEEYTRVKLGLKITSIITTTIMLVATILLFIFAQPLCKVLSENEDVITVAIKLVHFQCLSLPILGVYALSSMFMQNIGRYFSALVISIARQGIFFIPLLWMMDRYIGEFGLYIIQPICDYLAAILASILIAVKWKSIFKKHL